MSRTSINKRIERIRDHYLPPGTLAWRIDQLPPELKRAHQIWRERCDAINLTHKKRGGRNPFEILLEGYSLTPPMPSDVSLALWPDGLTRFRITDDMSLQDAADAYSAMLHEGY